MIATTVTLAMGSFEQNNRRGLSLIVRKDGVVVTVLETRDVWDRGTPEIVDGGCVGLSKF